eukprot:TRINITY_DN1792_c1_g2_i4.p1 TRINITY_DN1792_c1_g2~~TRINITY_DN1792_c1_g2_i4.p1  ORF type:complete len:357 (-),score=32.14 TRINITY_DN1792_c1_g2_i4:179-1249(-)
MFCLTWLVVDSWCCGFDINSILDQLTPIEFSPNDTGSVNFTNFVKAYHTTVWAEFVLLTCSLACVLLSLLEHSWVRFAPTDYNHCMNRLKIQIIPNHDVRTIQTPNDLTLPKLLVLSCFFWFLSPLTSVFYPFRETITASDIYLGPQGLSATSAYVALIRGILGFLIGLFKYISLIPITIPFFPSYMRVNLDIYHLNHKYSGSLTNIFAIPFTMFALLPVSLVLIYQVFSDWLLCACFVIIIFSPQIFWLEGYIDIHILEVGFYILYYITTIFVAAHLVFYDPSVCQGILSLITPHLVVITILKTVVSYLMWSVILRLIYLRLIDKAEDRDNYNHVTNDFADLSDSVPPQSLGSVH